MADFYEYVISLETYGDEWKGAIAAQAENLVDRHCRIKSVTLKPKKSEFVEHNAV